MTADAVDAVADAIVERAAGCPPIVVGVAGPVAVGKTTLVADLADRLRRRGLDVSTLCADAFLRPNAELAAAGLLMRKGFPESFDLGALTGAIAELRAGGSVDVPVYSHDDYDRVEGATATVEPAAVVVVEGVVVLHDALASSFDLTLYIDADEAELLDWYTRRFLELCEAAGSSGSSFYRMFAAQPVAERRATARAAWDGINAVNLAEHIAPSRSNADLVLLKGAGHRLVEVVRQERARRG